MPTITLVRITIAEPPTAKVPGATAQSIEIQRLARVLGRMRRDTVNLRLASWDTPLHVREVPGKPGSNVLYQLKLTHFGRAELYTVYNVGRPNRFASSDQATPYRLWEKGFRAEALERTWDTMLVKSVQESLRSAKQIGELTTVLHEIDPSLELADVMRYMRDRFGRFFSFEKMVVLAVGEHGDKLGISRNGLVVSHPDRRDDKIGWSRQKPTPRLLARMGFEPEVIRDAMRSIHALVEEARETEILNAEVHQVSQWHW
jgi:hypothetical protein